MAGLPAPNEASDAELIDVLDRFYSAFASRDAEALLALCAPDRDLIVVTSEEPSLRGPTELRAFLDRYAEGSTTYSWEWDRPTSPWWARSRGSSPKESRQRPAPITSCGTRTG